MKKLLVLMVLTAMLVSPTLGFAASPWTEADTYSDKVVGKLEFGVRNLLGGWTELYNQPVAAHNEDRSWFAGVGTGLVNTVVYTVGGAIHTATFLIPVDVPLPNNGLDL